MSSINKNQKFYTASHNATDDLHAERSKEFSEKIEMIDKGVLKDNDPVFDVKSTRRDFLKLMGFSTAAASLAACQGRVIESIPYANKPEEVTPGVADLYATTIHDGLDFASVLIKTREGRPIRILPNTLSPHYNSTNARVQGSLLSLYDMYRLTSPVSSEDEDLDWEVAFDEISSAINSISSKGQKVALLTPTIASPTTASVVDAFKAKFGNITHVSYDAISYDAIATAVEERYGKRFLPSYDFSKAQSIVSFNADFLGDWLGGGFEKSYADARNPKGETYARHYQFEANMTQSGANSDYRFALKPADQIYALISLYNRMLGTDFPTKPTVDESILDQIASSLKDAGSAGVVIADFNNKAIQHLCFEINKHLGSSVETFDAQSALNSAPYTGIQSLIDEMGSGAVGGLITYNVNPVYTLHNSDVFEALVSDLDLSVGLGIKDDETISMMDYRLPTNHHLESWNDTNPHNGFYTIGQPVIRPLFNTLQFEEILLNLASAQTTDYYTYLRNNWQTSVLTQKTGATWTQALHDGFFEVDQTEILSDRGVDVSTLMPSIQSMPESVDANHTDIVLYTKVGMGDGLATSNNPWLQELPDPISRMSWDNYLTISRSQAKELGLENWSVSNGGINGSVVNITLGDVTIENVPVLIQPGQAKNTVGLALGYGRTNAGKTGDGVGVNAYPFFLNGSAIQHNLKIQKVDAEHEFASVQIHHTMMGRDLVREVTLQDYKSQDKEDWNPATELETHKGRLPVSKIDLWDAVDRSIGHHFNLSIDLNSCTGCGACVVACHAENNVPVVGKYEIRVGRDMHWLRIDRYYSSDMTKEKGEEMGLGSIEKNALMEISSENPEVVFQPVMCQHCNHAPCETVCPVAATSHSRQGQNHMAYNRCIGTRYCANNCPYKVRRFNWFKYGMNEEFDFHMNNDLGRMVLNPDVTVRSRGVMEKCSLCIQTTQSAILNAKRQGTKLDHQEIQPACSTACATGALELGDINNSESPIIAKTEDDRKYYLLEAVGTKPNVFYHMKVRNKA